MPVTKPITPEELAELKKARDAVLSCRGTDFESGLELQRRLTAWGDLVEKHTDSLIAAAERLHAVETLCESELEVYSSAEERAEALTDVLDLIRKGRDDG